MSSATLRDPSTEARWEDVETVRSVPWRDLAIVRPLVTLGRGANGHVVEASVGTVAVAVKYTMCVLSDCRLHERRLLAYEILVAAYATALVVLEVCPHLCCLMRARSIPHVSRKRRASPAIPPARYAVSAVDAMLCTERFYGSVDKMGDVFAHDPAAVVTCAFQVLAACVALQGAYGISHNDLYPRNVLERETYSHAMTYSCAGVGYRVLTRGRLYALCDFATATSPTHLGREHWDVLTSHARTIAGMGIPPRFKDMRRHVLDYKRVEACRRDAGVFISNLAVLAPEEVRPWLRAALVILEDWPLGDVRAGPRALLGKMFAHEFMVAHGAPLGVVDACDAGGASFALDVDAETLALAGEYARDAVVDSSCPLEFTVP